MATFFKKNQKQVPFSDAINKKIHQSANKETFIITLYFFVFGVLWILLSDELLAFFIQDSEQYRTFQTYKGLLFIVLTTLYLYAVVRVRINTIHDAMHSILAAHEALSSTQKVLKKTEVERDSQAKLNDEIIGISPAAIIVWNKDLEVTEVNPQAREVLNLSYGKLSVDDLKRLKTLYQLLKESRDDEVQFSHESSDGIKISAWVKKEIEDADLREHFIAFGLDVTQQKNHEKALVQLAYYDQLTHAYNRTKLEEVIKTEPNIYALAILDLDDFKYINDALGHSLGDELLKYIAKVMKETLLPNHVFGRLGGDEFGILFKDLVSEAEVNQCLDKLAKALGEAWQVYHYQFSLRFSVGLALYKKHGRDFQSLIRAADIALYKAKAEGKNRRVWYDKTLENHNLDSIELARDLEDAILEKSIYLAYQPQYDLTTEAFIGVEAFCRWNNPTKGMIAPDVFIKIAEDTGQIYRLECLIFAQALKQKSIWEKQDYHFDVAINLSSKTLTSKRHFEDIFEIVKSHKVDYNELTIEITETALIEDVQQSLIHLEKLRELGIKIALDDFGTGFSSLTYLKDLPIQILKIDKTFVSQLDDNHKEKIIVKHVLTLANELGFSMVAEGIETKSQLGYLVHHNCHFGQGYYFKKPLSTEEMTTLLRKVG